jgi:hypothetical protein
VADAIRVKVVSLGTNREVELPQGSTVEDAVQLASIDPNLEVRIGGSVASNGQQLSDGDTVVATAPSVKHG